MEAISTFLVVMWCSSDALSCSDISQPEPFKDMAACQAARAEAARHPPVGSEAGALILSRCQYVLVEKPRSIEPDPNDPRYAERLAW